MAQQAHPRTIAELIIRSAEQEGVALRHKEEGRWVEVSYAQFVERAREIAKGLIALGIEPRQPVSILSDTRPEWTLADAGAFCAGVLVAPIYQTNSPSECQYVLAHSGARAVFCENEAQADKVEQVRPACPALEHVIVFSGAGPGRMGLDELVARGESVPDAEVDARVSAVAPDDVATLVYTSGTTGPPKACVLTHANFMAASETFEERLGLKEAGVPIDFFMFLPLAHVFARIIEVFTLDLGGTLTYWQRDQARLLDDLKESRPTYFPSVPRVWEKIYTAATSGIADQSALKRGMFHWALRTGGRVRALEQRGERVGRLLAARHRLADRLVLTKVRDLFGGRLVLAVTAAAPIAPEVLEFFDACGLTVLEGWGMTETCAAGTINTPRERKFGTVGKPLPVMRIRTAEDGELLAAGDNIFRGYFRDDEATATTLQDGWLATGDLGEIDEDGFVRITGRKKDIIITSSGKNIAPANIENELKRSRWISEAVVIGDRRPYLVALIALDPDEAPTLATHLGVDPSSMADDPRVHAEIQRVVDVVNEQFARIEQIKRFDLLSHELTQAGGELTPTLKVKRSVINEKFADRIDALYAGDRVPVG